MKEEAKNSRSQSVEPRPSAEMSAAPYSREEPYQFEVRERKGKYGTEIYVAEGVLEITGPVYATRDSQDHGVAERRKIASLFAASPALYEAAKRAFSDFDILITRGDLADEPRAFQTRDKLRAALALVAEQKEK